MEKEQLEKEFEAWRETKGGWPSRTECFEEWFYPKLVELVSKYKSAPTKEENL